MPEANSPKVTELVASLSGLEAPSSFPKYPHHKLDGGRDVTVLFPRVAQLCGPEPKGSSSTGVEGEGGKPAGAGHNPAFHDHFPQHHSQFIFHVFNSHIRYV